MSRSQSEEVIGLLWTLVAYNANYDFVAVFAFTMAFISFGAAIYYAVKDKDR